MSFKRARDDKEHGDAKWEDETWGTWGSRGEDCGLGFPVVEERSENGRIAVHHLSGAGVCVQTSPLSVWEGSRPHVEQAAHTDMHSHSQATVLAPNVAERTHTSTNSRGRPPSWRSHSYKPRQKKPKQKQDWGWVKNFQQLVAGCHRLHRSSSDSLNDTWF